MSIYLGKNRVDSPTRAQNVGSINGIIPDQMGNVELNASDVNAIYGLSVGKSLSSAGWYRVMEFVPTSINKSFDIVGSVGAIIRFYITRRYHWTTNETHEVSLSLVYTSIKWMEEESNAVVLGIDKIRYTTNSTTNKAYVDVHYILSQENQVGVNFNVYCPFDPNGINYQTQFTSKDFVAVADAPSGETILTTYVFAGSTKIPRQTFSPVTGAAYSNFGGCWFAREGKHCHVHVGISGITANTGTTVYTLPSDMKPPTLVLALGMSDFLSPARIIVYANGSVEVLSSTTSALLDIDFYVE